MWLIVKETVSSNNGNKIDDEVVTVFGMGLELFFEPIIYRFNNLSFAYPDFIPKRDSFVF